MTDERSDAPVVDATDEVEIGLEAPERGSATELMDHGAGFVRRCVAGAGFGRPGFGSRGLIGRWLLAAACPRPLE